MNRIAVICVILLSVPSLAFEPSTKGKKLISYGQDWPNTAYVRQNIREMEKHPFDGIVIGVTESREPSLGKGALGYRVWGREKIDPATIDHAIEDLKQTKFEKFTDNFIMIQSSPGDVDFFDPAWDVILHNVRMMARVAARGGCVGIEFDPEEYNDNHVWSYNRWSAEKRGGRTEEEYIAQARYRGEQFMGVISSEMQNAKVLMLLGPSLTAANMRAGKGDYRLLAPFVEGMCRGGDANAQLIDGFEQSYGYRTLVAFDEGRKTAVAARDIFGDRQAFDRMRVGFGLWTDYDSGKRGWHPGNPELNHFRPETFQTAIFGALSYTDEYVWIWRERLGEWENRKVDEGFERAMRDGRSGALKIAVKHATPTDAQMTFIKRAAAQQGYNDAETRDVLLDLPADRWRFNPDPDLAGVEQKLFRADFDDSQWATINIGQFWEEQGWDYDGVAWYRRTFNVPQIPGGKKIELIFGAVDESAAVWLNGEQIGAHDAGEVGWNMRFAIDATGKIRAGDNQLTVRVLDRVGPGGIWKSVKLLASPL